MDEHEVAPIHWAYIESARTAIKQLAYAAKTWHIRHPSKEADATAAAFRWLSIPLEHGMWGVALEDLGADPSGGVAEAYETARIAASDPHQERDARLTLMRATGRFRSVREDRDWIPPVYAAVRDMTKSAVSSAVRAAAIATIRVYAEALADLDADSHARGEYFVSDRGGGVMGVHAALTYESTIDALGAGVLSILKEDFGRWVGIADDPVFASLRGAVDSALECSKEYGQRTFSLGIDPKNLNIESAWS